MDKKAKIFVAGHRGLVGSAIVRKLQAGGYSNLVVRTHAELDLTRQAEVDAFFAAEKPNYVFLAAAKVGGIHANDTYPAEFIHVNLEIQNNVIDAAYRHRIKRLLFLGSSCIYPKFAPQPIREDYLLTGALEPTNQAYALAKIAGIEMCRSYNHQYGTEYLAAMPTNLYGPGDNYHPQNSHVIPALIRRFHEAKVSGAKDVEIWGTGTPRREFLYSDDLADACVFMMERAFMPGFDPLINVGVGKDLSIRELAVLIADVVDFRGALTFNPERPDGTPQKLLDVSRVESLGWRAKTSLRQGLENAYADFLARHAPFAVPLVS
jgi:GDP-L-fucose synthase